MQTIEDESVSKKILDKVNAMNGKMFLVSTALGVAYASFPFGALFAK